MIHETQALYHLVNILIILALALFYTAIKNKQLLSTVEGKSAKPKDSAQPEKKESLEDEPTENKKSFGKEAIKNLSAGLFIYLMYVVYTSLKP